MTMNTDQTSTQNLAIPRWSFLIFIFLYTVAVKLFPYVLYRMGMNVEQNFTMYPWNFTPLFAVCLFGGAVYRSKLNAIWVPLAIMLVADLGIGVITGHPEWAFYSNQVVVYAATALCAVLGYLLRSRRSFEKIAVTGLASCFAFYLVTNFGVWVGSTIYSQDMSGLIQCYVAGLPFLRNSIIATGVFSAVLFSPACLRLVNAQHVDVDSREELAPVSAA